MAAIFAPFTAEQIEGLNRWQNAGYVHEFTCPTNHESSRTLIATEGGWHCPFCDYRQNWAHDFMASGPPLDRLQEQN